MPELGSNDDFTVLLDDAFLYARRENEHTEIYYIKDAGKWMDFYEYLDFEVKRQRQPPPNDSSDQ